MSKYKTTWHDIAKAILRKEEFITEEQLIEQDKQDIQEFSRSQLDALARQYSDLKGKTISIDNANKLRKIFDKIPNHFLNDLRKKHIPFLSGLALSRMVQKGIPVREDTDYLKSKLNTHQINNIKNTWKSKKASDVTPGVKAMIKKMDIPTQLAIKQANIPHLSKLIEVNEDTDIDSVNDVALKNAEKSKSKDKDTKESKALTKEEQDHIKKEFGIKYEALSPEKQKQMDQLMKDFLARGGKIKKLKPGIAKGAGHLDKRGPYKADMLKGPKKHLAAQKDNSDELAGGKTATGQKVSKVDTRPNIREV